MAATQVIQLEVKYFNNFLQKHTRANKDDNDNYNDNHEREKSGRNSDTNNVVALDQPNNVLDVSSYFSAMIANGVYLAPQSRFTLETPSTITNNLMFEMPATSYVIQQLCDPIPAHEISAILSLGNSYTQCLNNTNDALIIYDFHHLLNRGRGLKNSTTSQPLN